MKMIDQLIVVIIREIHSIPKRKFEHLYTTGSIHQAVRESSCGVWGLSHAIEKAYKRFEGDFRATANIHTPLILSVTPYFSDELGVSGLSIHRRILIGSLRNRKALPKYKAAYTKLFWLPRSSRTQFFGNGQ